MDAGGITLTIGHVAALIGFIFALVGSSGGLLLAIIGYFVRREFEKQASLIEEIRKFNEWVRAELAKYEVNVGASDVSLKSIHDDLNSHVTREESIFWAKIEAIQDAIRIQNETVLQRIASVEARMPNGELKQLAKDVAILVGEMSSLKRMSLSAEDHITEHNAEAEQWKRKIEVDSNRIDAIERSLAHLANDSRRRSTDAGGEMFERRS